MVTHIVAALWLCASVKAFKASEFAENIFTRTVSQK